ncbi:uncharacterized protein LOC121783460 [Salvia splendens]|uniref:uncharacterized protein LOC121783460 n=1 Tax=Salvia splendens TaxID=180675 RepID=UPI001C279BAB|nr:uncharacterized protein LOC121783460 [Salvia splendens]
MQPIREASVSSSKRNRNEIDGDLSRRCQRSRIEEKKSVSTPPGGGRLGCTTADPRAPASMNENQILAVVGAKDVVPHHYAPLRLPGPARERNPPGTRQPAPPPSGNLIHTLAMSPIKELLKQETWHHLP